MSKCSVVLAYTGEVCYSFSFLYKEKQVVVQGIVLCIG